ncbi:hypothetical protein PS9374_07187 [Planomonospora sphaerica]|uniref:Uncharacterized protein n=1 Tax=Planomonospora sphaerica TaxID=161355 RepID=A0A171DR19_9ACTN|nr:DUF6461 domain-containing protein [Planomonospora sphaerica]GAT71496.1 hypothetical protein PS9374_07187 [Planomonospora sphaerica]
MVDYHTHRSIASGPFGIGVCITWSSGREPRDLLAILSGGTFQFSWCDFDEAVERSLDENVILAGQLGRWTVTVEPTGFQGSLHENTLRASQGGQMLSVFWNVNGDARVVHCVDGRIHAEFDPLDPDDVWGDDPSLIQSWIEDLDFDGDWQASALALGELLSGEVLDNAWLARQHQCALVTQENDGEAVLDLTPAMREYLTTDPRLAAIATDLSVARLPEITIFCVELASATAHLDPEVTTTVVAAVRDSSASREMLRAEIAALAEATIAEAFAIQVKDLANQMHQRATALRVLALALDPDPFRAAWDSTWRAGDLRYGRGGHIQHGILRELVRSLATLI